MALCDLPLRPPCYGAGGSLAQAQFAHKELQRHLEKHSGMGKVLWLTSPLTRALETMLLAWPDVEGLAQGRPGSSGSALSAQPANHTVMVLRWGSSTPGSMPGSTRQARMLCGTPRCVLGARQLHCCSAKCGVAFGVPRAWQC